MARALVVSSFVLARLASRCNAFVATGIGERLAVCGLECGQSSSTTLCTARVLAA